MRAACPGRDGRLSRSEKDPRIGAFMPTAQRLGRHELINRSAALTYYGILALIPGMLVLFSLIGLLGTEDTVDEVLKVVQEVGPGDSQGPLRQPLEDLIKSDTRSGTYLGLGLLGVLWTASAYVGSFFRASATLWDVGARPVWRAWPARMGHDRHPDPALGRAPRGRDHRKGRDLRRRRDRARGSARDPLQHLQVAGAAARGPPHRQRPLPHRPPAAALGDQLRLLTPAGTFAVVASVLLSIGYSVYANLFASYGTAYGALGTTVAAIVWLWLTNLVLLMGVEADAELEIWRGENQPGPPA